ncbi:DUF4034 domain-containing protein [Micromonospora sp. WMMC250]|uniref:DUF4034 domain-containing protein n=1 Tax=Micromonospora sp. WMMC250 TaxID=3014781 RepID=UPI0022B5EAF8|nr:DUF4034 domain-containing protein [Micromonospora sp. WMMC250]MCZ7374680.1 DUF4034 domain-containing protein [Micromonospora sp. WMMC250]
MWGFLKRSKAPALDPTYGDPHRKALIRALEKRRWKFARELLTMAADPDEMAFLMEAVGGVDGIQDWIGEWIDAEPDSTLPVLVAGCHAVHWAWDARGGKRAKYTTAEQFKGFHERLHYAESLLEKVLAREPDNVTARAWLVTSARGLGVGAAEARERFEAVTRLHPGHVVAHEQRLQYLCAKWSGSHEEMFDFARGAAAAAGPFSLLHELVAVAHFERWEATDIEDGNAYFDSDEVRAELLAAAESSIFHPDYVPAGPGWAPRLAIFALTFELAEEFDAAAHAFALLDGMVTEWPWQVLGDPVEKFTASRDWVATNRGAA